MSVKFRKMISLVILMAIFFVSAVCFADPTTTYPKTKSVAPPPSETILLDDEK